MNKPATKEPSMDEILSSIRQIIADDDESAAPRRPSLQVAPDPMEAMLAVGKAGEDNEPLALSSAQIVPENESVADMGFEALLADAQSETAADAAPTLVVPDDIGFTAAEAADDEDEGEEEIELPSFNPVDSASEVDADTIVSPEPEIESVPVLAAIHAEEDHSVSEPIAFARPSVAAASPMPDATLSADLAEGLLETTTKSAIRGSMEKLSAAGIGVVASPNLGNANLTIEAMVREMLRPMLKDWLDENLPAVVERMVEKEISRVARGD